MTNAKTFNPDAVTVPAVAAVYHALWIALDVIQAGKGDGRANEITEEWLERVVGYLELEIKEAISLLKKPAQGDLEQCNRLPCLIDWANRTGNHKELARLAALHTATEMKSIKAARSAVARVS